MRRYNQVSLKDLFTTNPSELLVPNHRLINPYRGNSGSSDSTVAGGSQAGSQFLPGPGGNLGGASNSQAVSYSQYSGGAANGATGGGSGTCDSQETQYVRPMSQSLLQFPPKNGSESTHGQHSSSSPRSIMYNRYPGKDSLFVRDPPSKQLHQQQMTKKPSPRRQTTGAKGQVNVMGSSCSSLSSRLAAAVPGGLPLEQMQLYKARAVENDQRDTLNSLMISMGNCSSDVKIISADLKLVSTDLTVSAKDLNGVSKEVKDLLSSVAVISHDVNELKMTADVQNDIKVIVSEVKDLVVGVKDTIALTKREVETTVLSAESKLGQLVQSFDSGIMTSASSLGSCLVQWDKIRTDAEAVTNSALVQQLDLKDSKIARLEVELKNLETNGTGDISRHFVKLSERQDEGMKDLRSAFDQQIDILHQGVGEGFSRITAVLKETCDQTMNSLRQQLKTELDDQRRFINIELNNCLSTVESMISNVLATKTDQLFTSLLSRLNEHYDAERGQAAVTKQNIQLLSAMNPHPPSYTISKNMSDETVLDLTRRSFISSTDPTYVATDLSKTNPNHVPSLTSVADKWPRVNLSSSIAPLTSTASESNSAGPTLEVLNISKSYPSLMTNSPRVNILDVISSRTTVTSPGIIMASSLSSRTSMRSVTCAPLKNNVQNISEKPPNILSVYSLPMGGQSDMKTCLLRSAISTAAAKESQSSQFQTTLSSYALSPFVSPSLVSCNEIRLNSTIHPVFSKIGVNPSPIATVLPQIQIHGPVTVQQKCPDSIGLDVGRRVTATISQADALIEDISVHVVSGSVALAATNDDVTKIATGDLVVKGPQNDTGLDGSHAAVSCTATKRPAGEASHKRAFKKETSAKSNSKEQRENMRLRCRSAVNRTDDRQQLRCGEVKIRSERQNSVPKQPDDYIRINDKDHESKVVNRVVDGDVNQMVDNTEKFDYHTHESDVQRYANVVGFNSNRFTTTTNNFQEMAKPLNEKTVSTKKSDATASKSFEPSGFPLSLAPPIKKVQRASARKKPMPSQRQSDESKNLVERKTDSQEKGRTGNHGSLCSKVVQTTAGNFKYGKKGKKAIQVSYPFNTTISFVKSINSDSTNANGIGKTMGSDHQKRSDLNNGNVTKGSSSKKTAGKTKTCKKTRSPVKKKNIDKNTGAKKGMPVSKAHNNKKRDSAQISETNDNLPTGKDLGESPIVTVMSPKKKRSCNTNQSIKKSNADASRIKKFIAPVVSHCSFIKATPAVITSCSNKSDFSSKTAGPSLYLLDESTSVMPPSKQVVVPCSCKITAAASHSWVTSRGAQLSPFDENQVVPDSHSDEFSFLSSSGDDEVYCSKATDTLKTKTLRTYGATKFPPALKDKRADDLWWNAIINKDCRSSSAVPVTQKKCNVFQSQDDDEDSDTIDASSILPFKRYP